jgi:hypothetical protein
MLRGARLALCPVCRTVTLATLDFDRLCVEPARDDLELGVPMDTAQPPAFEPTPTVATRQDLGRTLYVALASVLLALLAVGAVVLLAVGVVLSRTPTDPATVVRPRMLDERPGLPRVSGDPLIVPTAPQATPATTVRAMPVPRATSPAPVPAAPNPGPPPSSPSSDPPAPVQPAAPASTVRGLVDQGWTLVEHDIPAATARFESALARRPAHPDANYGLGYVLLRQGRTLDARPYLCRALDGADITTQREITGLLARHQLSCP